MAAWALDIALLDVVSDNDATRGTLTPLRRARGSGPVLWLRDPGFDLVLSHQRNAHTELPVGLLMGLRLLYDCPFCGHTVRAVRGGCPRCASLLWTALMAGTCVALPVRTVRATSLE